MKLSVIIPTKNRRKVLEKCLKAIVAQDIDKKNFEIIVVDDGSVDETANFMKHFINVAKENNIFYYLQQNKNPAAARNLGFEKSQGELVLFNDDDIIQQEGCLAEHIKVHTLFPDKHIAVGGNFFTEQKASVCQIHSSYRKICCVDSQNIIWHEHWTYLWTKNVSFKREFFEKFGFFDPDLEQDEDMEIGYRLSKHGLSLLIAENALNIDECPVTDTRYFITSKAQKYGRAFFVCHKKHPDLLEDLEKEGYLEFFFRPSKKSSLIKKIRFFLAKVLVNSFNVNLWIFIIGFLENCYRPLARRISWMVFKYNHRRVYYIEQNKSARICRLGDIQKIITDD
jgi:glycosyltransferase involved in cell wall biosynthesis